MSGLERTAVEDALAGVYDKVSKVADDLRLNTYPNLMEMVA
jgi:hypothetical protein